MTGIPETTRRFTLDVQPGHESEALKLALDFAERYQDHFRDKRPERHGVGYGIPGRGAEFYVFDSASHIRVKDGSK